MSPATTLVAIGQPCEAAIEWANRQLRQAGLQVMRTFDLQSARLAHEDCSCPHHGSAGCDCRIVVLLVYGVAPQPACLVVHARDQQTYFSLAEFPEHRDETLEGEVRQALLQDLYV